MKHQVLACAVALTAGATARADVETQVVVSASSGYTDNAQGATREAPVGSPSAQDDLYFQVEPTLLLAHQGSRALERLALRLAGTHYLNQTSADSLVALGDLALDLDLAPQTRLILTVAGGYERLSAATASTVAEVVPAGPIERARVAATAALAQDFSGRVRGVDQLTLGASLPIGDSTEPRAFSVGDALSAQLTFRRDAVSATVAGTANHYQPTGEGDSREDYSIVADVGWLRELSAFWTLGVTAGAALLISDTGEQVAPLGSLRLGWGRLDASFYVEASESVTSNLQVGQTFVVSSLTVGVATALGLFRLDTHLGGARATTVGGDEVTTDSARISSALTYDLRENIGLRLTHELSYQVTQAAMDTTLLRNSVMLGLVASFPARAPRARPPVIELRPRESEERDRAEEAR